MKEYKAAIYLRLSKEDREKNNSIDMQREITRKYAKEHKFSIVDEYIDNGYSGILDSRPALNRLMTDIIRNKINMVIVKDMSRLTRNKNLTSYYTDIFFPDNDVRLISVTEYVDTGKRYEIDDVVAISGIVNQSYLEDISRKIKSVKKNFKEQGKFIEGSVVYGYKKDKQDKYKIIIDDAVSPIIKEIFNLFISGIGPTKIAEKLNEKRILTPSQYLNLKVTGKYWTKNMVNRILNDPTYTGRLVLNKYENDLKLKKRIVTPKSQYKYKENTHEAIISIKDYETVQLMKGNRTKQDNKTYIYLLKGLVFCQNCGRSMTYKNSKPIRIDANGNISGKKNDLGYFICNEHYRHKEICNQTNKIMENDLNKIVLDKISSKLKELQISKYVKEVAIYRQKRDPSIIEYKKLQNEIIKQENNFKILYSKKVEGIITEKSFIEQYKQYKETVKNLKERQDRLETDNKKYNNQNELDKLIIDFFDCKEFDNTIIKKLVEKIEVGENNQVKISLKV